MRSASLYVCDPTTQRSGPSVGTNSLGLRAQAQDDAEGHLLQSAEAALRTLGGLQQEEEVTEAAAQRMCKYQRARDALN